MLAPFGLDVEKIVELLVAKNLKVPELYWNDADLVRSIVAAVVADTMLFVDGTLTVEKWEAAGE